jgi:short-subunit dehydrogenase
MTARDIDRAVDINLRAPMQLSRAFVHGHLDSGRPGHIVLVGSLAGIVTSPDSRLYNTTKFGLRGFALALRADLADTPVGVTLVAPGFIRDAGMFADSGVVLPRVVRTKSPGDVADAVVKGIESNRGEVFVSPIELRLLATLGSMVPSLSQAAQQRFGVAERRQR